MIEFLKKHNVMLIAGIFGVLLGVTLNTLLRNHENKKYLQSLIKEYNKLLEKSKSSALSSEEQKWMDKLDSEIYVMKFKCMA